VPDEIGADEAGATAHEESAHDVDRDEPPL